MRCVDSWPARGAHDAGMSGTVLGEVQCVHVCVHLWSDRLMVNETLQCMCNMERRMVEFSDVKSD